jgi:hypothetical protein
MIWALHPHSRGLAGDGQERPTTGKSMRIGLDLPKARMFLGLVFTLSLATQGADNAQSLNVKIGLWEVTTTVTTSEEMPIPAGLLEKLTPGQRARVEERMKARKSEPGKTTIKKQCLTRKHLDDGIPFGRDRKSCTRTVLTSTSTKVDTRVECLGKGFKTSGIFQIEALSTENVKGSMRFSATGGANATNSTSTFTAKWIGPLCSTTK